MGARMCVVNGMDVVLSAGAGEGGGVGCVWMMALLAWCSCPALNMALFKSRGLNVLVCGGCCSCKIGVGFGQCDGNLGGNGVNLVQVICGPN